MDVIHKQTMMKLGGHYRGPFAHILEEDALREYLDYPLDWEDFKSDPSYFKEHIGEGVEGCGFGWVEKICALGFRYTDLPVGAYSLVQEDKRIQKCPVNPKKCFIGVHELFDKVLVLGDLPV